MTPQHAAALTYVERGWHVVALHHVTEDGRCSCGRGGEDHATGKHPRERRWQDNPALSAADVMTLWERWPEAGVGIATGATSGIFVLDVDPKNGGDETLRLLVESHGELPATYVVATGGGGWHYYFALPDFTVTNSPGRLGDGLDIRGNGGQVVAPPSRTPQGGYEAADGDAKVLPAPSWLLDLIRPPARPERVPAGRVERASDDIGRYVAAAVASEVQRVEDAPEGRRNDTLNRATFSLAQIVAHDDSGLDVDELATTMADAGLAAGLDAHEVTATVRSGITGGLSSPRELWPPEPKQEAGFFIPFEGEVGAKWPKREWDDLGNADRLLDHFRGRMLWVLEDREWAIYDGSRWQRQSDALAQHLAQRMMSLLPVTEAYSYSEVASGEDPSPREAFVKWVGKQRSAPKIAAALKSARGLTEFHAHGHEFDSHIGLLNVTNGVLDLGRDKLSGHDPTLRMILQARAGYDPDAACPRWERFLAETQPDPEMRAFIQRLVGYSLTGSLAEQVMAIHHGTGANGKSVFLSVLGEVFGDYSQVVPRHTLLTKQSDGIATDVARMVGRRFLQTSETAVGKRLDEEIIKGITGGDTQVARHLYGREFEFRPQGTIHYATNHLPRLTDAESIWRRLILVGWNVTIPPGERDGHLAETIAREEADGVLAWAVRGALAWRELGGLVVPEAARLALAEYREDSDVFGDFLRDETVPLPAGAYTPVNELYDAYTRWCFQAGHHAMARNSFGTVLSERGYRYERRRVGGSRPRCYEGIGVREPATAYPPELT